MEQLPIVIRPSTNSGEDFAFIYNTWVQSFRNQIDNKWQDYQHYKAKQSLIIQSILKRTNSTKVLLASYADDPDTYLGWICYEQLTKFKVVHYMYVKKIYKRNGIAKMLLTRAGFKIDKPIPCSHATYILDKVADKYQVLYLPELKKGAYLYEKL